MHNRGKELLGHGFKNYLVQRYSGINPRCAPIENPQENSILEKYHQVILNIVHMFYLQNNCLSKDCPCSGILPATNFAV